MLCKWGNRPPDCINKPRKTWGLDPAVLFGEMIQRFRPRTGSSGLVDVITLAVGRGHVVAALTAHNGVCSAGSQLMSATKNRCPSSHRRGSERNCIGSMPISVRSTAKTLRPSSTSRLQSLGINRTSVQTDQRGLYANMCNDT